MTTPKVNEAVALDGTEWQLLIQGGKLTRAQINAVIAFARKNYTTDNLPEGTTRLYFSDARAIAALAGALSTKADKSELSGLVLSVNNKTGAVTLTKADIGLNNVNNTADANKPVSSATQAALDLKADKSQIVVPPVTSVAGKTGAVTLAKADIGLGSVENTSDASKPVSTAQAAAIAAAKIRVAKATAATNASGIATLTFSPAFTSAPDVGVIDGWVGEQMVTGAVIDGTVTATGCQVQVMVSRGTLLLTSGPFQKAAAGVSITVRAIGN